MDYLTEKDNLKVAEYLSDGGFISVGQKKQEFKNALDAAMKAVTRSDIFSFIFNDRKDLRAELSSSAKRSGIDPIDFLYSVAKHHDKKENRSILARLIFGRGDSMTEKEIKEAKCTKTDEQKTAINKAVKAYTRSSISAFLSCNREELKNELHGCAEVDDEVGYFGYMSRFERIYRKKENRSFLGRVIFG